MGLVNSEFFVSDLHFVKVLVLVLVLYFSQVI